MMTNAREKDGWGIIVKTDRGGGSTTTQLTEKQARMTVVPFKFDMTIRYRQQTGPHNYIRQG
jgi:hypothetical protein